MCRNGLIWPQIPLLLKGFATRGGNERKVLILGFLRYFSIFALFLYFYNLYAFLQKERKSAKSEKSVIWTKISLKWARKTKGFVKSQFLVKVCEFFVRSIIFVIFWKCHGEYISLKLWFLTKNHKKHWIMIFTKPFVSLLISMKFWSKSRISHFLHFFAFLQKMRKIIKWRGNAKNAKIW